MSPALNGNIFDTSWFAEIGYIYSTFIELHCVVFILDILLDVEPISEGP